MQKYRNILIPSIVNLGDVLLATAAVSLLKKQYPRAKITMMVRPIAAEILQNHPLIDEVIVYDYKSKDKPIGKILALVRTLRARKFDLSICFDRKLRTSVLSLMAGIPVRVGIDHVVDNRRSLMTYLYTDVIIIPHDNVIHQVETYQAIIRKFTGCHGSMVPVIGAIMPEHEQRARTLLAILPKKGTVRIGLCVKGTFALKNWPQQRFVETVEGLAAQYDASFFIIGALEDKAYAAQVIAKTKTPIVNFCGQTGLMDLAALLHRTDLFITVDTGASHIGAVVGVPMVTIFGCTSPKMWRPISDKALVISSNERCCPCNVGYNECLKHRCMNNISVDQVLEKAELVLDLYKYEVKSI